MLLASANISRWDVDPTGQWHQQHMADTPWHSTNNAFLPVACEQVEKGRAGKMKAYGYRNICVYMCIFFVLGVDDSAA